MKRRLAVLVLAFTMVLTMSASVFADDAYDQARTAAKGVALANAAFTKQLNIAEGLTVPGTTMTFKFEKVTDEANTITGADLPTIADQTITFASTDTITNDKVEKDIALSSIFKVGKANTDNLKKAGVYVYDVTETSNGFTDVTSGELEKRMTKSEAKYRVRIYVTNGANNTLECNTVTVDKLKNDAGDDKPASQDPNAAKVDATDTDTTDTNHSSQFRFENTYREKKNTTEEPKDPDTPDDPTTGKFGVLGVSKTVKGNFGDKSNGFSFTLSLTAPSTYDPDIDGNGFKYKKADGTEGTATFAKADDASVYTCTVTDTIAHGQSLSFKSIPAGTKFTTSETLPDTIDNKAKYATTANLGSVPADGTVFNGEGASTSQKIVGDADAANANTAFYINKFDDSAITPTGIIINNLPYVLLIGIALGGIVLFSRKRRYE